MIGLLITVIVIVPLLLFVVWQYLQEARVQIDAGNVGVLVARGKAHENALQPGVHYLWPFRQQMIQVYTLREVSYTAADDERADGPALATDIGGRTEARIAYVLRYRIDPDHLKRVHEFIGPHGIDELALDYTNQAIVDYLGDADIDIDDLYGPSRRALECSIREQLSGHLADRGIIVTLFGIRDVSLGALGQVLQDTRRARLELQREAARAEVRRARIANESEQAQALSEALDDSVLRYLQIEAWREYVDRWDGRGQLPLAFPGIGEQPGARVRPTPSADDPQAAPEPRDVEDGTIPQGGTDV